MTRPKSRSLDRASILRAIRANPRVLAKRGVRRISLFGSFARNRARRDSDIDFLVDFAAPTYDNFVGLSRDLERLFGRRVEILTPDGLSSIRIRGVAESIRKSLVHA